MTKLAKINSRVLLLIKILFIAALIYVIYMQLSKAQSNQQDELVLAAPLGLLLTLLLMPLNWTLEGMKWRSILLKLKNRIPFKTLLFSLFTGISASLFTPNRAGNFIGRMIWFGSAIRVQVSVLSIYGNMAQWLASVLFGLLGLMLIDSFNMPELSTWQFILIAAIIVVMLLLYFIPYWIPQFLGRFMYQRKMEHAARILKEHHDLKWQLLLYSLLRHAVFSSQFALTLYAFGIEITQNLFFAIWVTYRITTLIPSPLVGKLLIRESVALFVLSAVAINENTILVSTVLIWFINLSIPAIIGGIIWLKWKPLN
jgi:uncharacterized membrane protein YbhN (UPF0104 family)